MRTKKVLARAVVGVGLGIAALNGVVLAGGGATALPEPPPIADCALVLGAGVWEDGKPSDVLRDRLDEALEVWRAGRVKKILVSGDHHTAGYDEPNAMRRYLEARGVPSAAVFMDHAGLDTYSSAWRARNVFGAKRVVVITQEFHLARAVWLARALGLEAEGSAADRRLYRGAVWLHAREVASRAKAVLDVAVRRTPRHGPASPAVDLAGDGRVTAG